MVGLQEIMALFLLLSGLGLEQPPSEASVTEVQKYAPSSANYHLFLDTKGWMKTATEKAQSLAKEPLMEDLVGKMSADQITYAIDMARTTAKGVLGVDPISDVHWVSAWFKLKQKAEPQFIIAAKGNWPRNHIDAIASRTGVKIETVNGRKLLRGPDKRLAVALTSDGILLFGSAPWIAPRLSAGWRAPRVEPAVKELFNHKPHMVLYSQPSPESGNTVKKWLTGNASILRWLLLGHLRFGIALDNRGVTGYWQGTNAASAERARLTAEGTLSLLRSTHHGITGFVKLLLAWVPKNPKNRFATAVHKHRNAILKLVTSMTGDGGFKADVNLDARKHIVRVEARGNSTKEVLPIGGLPLIGAAALFVVGTSAASKAKTGDSKAASPVPAK